MSNYETRPTVLISTESAPCRMGWDEIVPALLPFAGQNSRRVVVVETYPGVDADDILERLVEQLVPDLVVRSADAFVQPAALKAMFLDTLSDDPVFGFMWPWTIEAYFDAERSAHLRAQITRARGLILVVGTGASWLVEEADMLLSANLGRWEIQQRQRAHRAGNLGFANADAHPAELYKNAFFLDWRVGDRIRHGIYSKVNFFLDMTDQVRPVMLAGDVLRAAVRQIVRQPSVSSPSSIPVRRGVSGCAVSWA